MNLETRLTPFEHTDLMFKKVKQTALAETKEERKEFITFFTEFLEGLKYCMSLDAFQTQHYFNAVNCSARNNCLHITEFVKFYQQITHPILYREENKLN